jgi:papilin
MFLLGYHDILLIPQGATNIHVRERRPSNNYLAIRNRQGTYYLNGNWRIDIPRTFTIAGSIWHYDRTPQGFAAPDSISCIGPVTEPVYIVVSKSIKTYRRYDDYPNLFLSSFRKRRT